MKELVAASPEREPKQPSAATCVLEDPGRPQYRPYPVEYTSAVSGEPETVRRRDIRWPSVAEAVVRADVVGAEVLPSRPFIAKGGATIWGEPRFTGPATIVIRGAVSTEELIQIDEPDRIGAVPAGERWISLVIKAFPHVRSMTREEASAYRAFKRKVSRRIGRIDLP